ncbi:MAG: hypothetical protein ACI9JR_003073, partial [Gammaproteobacteria bacterium]
PENEWAETMNKGRAIFRAVSLAEAGLSTKLPASLPSSLSNKDDGQATDQEAVS